MNFAMLGVTTFELKRDALFFAPIFSVDDPVTGPFFCLPIRYLGPSTSRDQLSDQPAAYSRHQTKKADRIGHKSGGQQQRAPDNQHNPFQQLKCGELPAIHQFSGLHECRQPLLTQQGSAQNRGPDHETHGRQRSNTLANLNQQINFGNRYRKKEQEQNRENRHEVENQSLTNGRWKAFSISSGPCPQPARNVYNANATKIQRLTISASG